jgi:hypothetical protein
LVKTKWIAETNYKSKDGKVTMVSGMQGKTTLRGKESRTQGAYDTRSRYAGVQTRQTGQMTWKGNQWTHTPTSSATQPDYGK